MRRALLLIALLALPLRLAADTFPSQERGFQAEKAFHVGDFDTVNLFNGNLVLTIPIGGSYPVGGSFSYGLVLTYNSNVWDYQQSASNLTQAVPSRRSNAGLGWRLSLGELLEPTDPDNDTLVWNYIGADGSEHRFYDSLHDGESVTTGVKYTRDGSYLRFRYVASDKRAVDFPDGMIQTFTRWASWDWRLTRIEDRSGNFVDITYIHDINTGEVKTWQIQDQAGRTQKVNFATASWYNRVVGSVVLSAFNGATATYSFSHTTVSLPRACPDNDPQTGNVTVPLLTSITLPDGSTWSMPTSDHHLSDAEGCRLPGVLKGITAPLLGRVEWGYGGYAFPAETDEKPWRDFSHGVYSRTLRNNAGTAVGTWTYTPALNPIPNELNPAREAIRTVVTPLGDKTESYFSVALDDAYTGWTKFDYSLPFSRFVDDGGSPPLYLSTRTWDCDGGAVNCVLKRSTYLAYERDEGLLAEFQKNLDRNRRMSASKTVYEDDGGRWEAAAHSSFDGLGHYRQTVLSGNFDAGNSATLFTNYNPARGTYPGSFVMLGSGDPWVLGTYSEQTRTEGGVTAKSEHCFDTATGLLLRTRTLKTGTSRGANDVLSAYSYASGNLIREEHFGGDVQSLGTGELCSLALPANQYRIDHGWQYGTRNSSRYSDGSGVALPFKSLDLDIDFSTGLPKASRDTSNLRTDFEYDNLGRLTWVKPEAGHDGWTQYLYTRALSASPAQVQVLRQPNGGGTALAESLIQYDSFGRVWQEHLRMPDGTWSIRQTNYNPLHWKTQVSEQGNTAKKTEYLSYDPFGRPGTIRPPDGSAHDVTFSYLGVRKVSRTSKVGNSLVNGAIHEVLSTTQEFYDRQGRLYQVREQAEASGSDTTTTYSYDVGNRLSQVKQVTSAGTQNRFFTYDNRGFLTQEIHPEKGASGNGSVSYSSYDARGHAGRKIDGANDLTFTRDRAERLTQIAETGGQALKIFVYGTSNAVGVRTNGRLESATRYNYVGSPFNSTVAITETYTYGGLQGRVSRKNTQMLYNGSPSESFGQTWSWNALGDPAAVGYPECTFAACVPVARSVGFGYTRGFLTSVPGWASAVSYHANGMVNQVTHANGVVDTQANDPNGMRRPSAISAALGSTTLWTSGAYAYDGSGNIVKTGNGYYLYDRVSRLIEGRVYDGPLGGGTQKWQSYTYDPFGNIQSIGGTSGRSTPTSSATNRLNGTGTSYDAAGNLTAWNGNVYEYDRFNQMTRMVSGAEDWRYIYTPGDERFWSYRVGGGGSLWALRDGDGRLLREYEAHTSWGTFKDYIYRGTHLLAASHSSQGVSHFHLDHLGTPRLVTEGGTGGDFYTLAPCRVLDTRAQSAPLSAGETRMVQMVGTCGIPSTAAAVSLNVTAVDATAEGELTGFAATVPRPATSTLSFPVLVNRANNAILMLGEGALSFFNNQASGTVHLVIDVNGYFTKDSGTVLAYHVYYPFGEEATDFNQDTEQMKLTGHERDLASLAGAGDDLDYMHARFYSPLTARFTGVDSFPGAVASPQSWNRYAYVTGNPLRYTDPLGQFACGPEGLWDCAAAVSDTINVSSKKDGAAKSRSGTGGLLGLILSNIRSIGSLDFLPRLLRSAGRDSDTLAPMIYMDGKFTRALPAQEELVTAALIVTAAVSLNQANQQVKRGQAPHDVERVDKGSGPHEHDHVHMKGDHALNRDGTWKHGGRPLNQ